MKIMMVMVFEYNDCSYFSLDSLVETFAFWMLGYIPLVGLFAWSFERYER